MPLDRIVTKKLAGEEDLLLGEGSEAQTRYSGSRIITKLNLAKWVVNAAALTALNTAIHTRARLGVSDLEFYWKAGDTQTANGTTIISGIAGIVGNWLRSKNSSLNVWVEDFGALADGVTSDSAAFEAAITFLESAIASGKAPGGVLNLRGHVYLLDSRLRFGSYITLAGQGVFSTTLYFDDVVTGKCVEVISSDELTNTKDSRLANLTVRMGTSSTYGLYLFGAYGHSGFNNIRVTNVNQIGVFLGFFPTVVEVFDIGELTILAGTAVPIGTRQGLVVNNGAINNVNSLNIQGVSGSLFAQSVRLQFGNINIKAFVASYTTKGLSLEQTTTGGHVVNIEQAVGLVGVVSLIDVSTSFVGTINLAQAKGVIGTDVLLNNINGDSFIDKTINSYHYSSKGGGLGTQITNFDTVIANNFRNRGLATNCKITTNNKIHSALVGQDDGNDSIALAYSYDGIGYELIVGLASTVGGILKEVYRFGRMRDTASRAVVAKQVDLVYGSVINIDASLGNSMLLIVTNSSNFVINSPTNSLKGQLMYLTVKNSSGGAIGGVSWPADFRVVSLPIPPNGFSRTLTLLYNGSQWVEVSNASNVPN